MLPHCVNCVNPSNHKHVSVWFPHHPCCFSVVFFHCGRVYFMIQSEALLEMTERNVNIAKSNHWRKCCQGHRNAWRVHAHPSVPTHTCRCNHPQFSMRSYFQPAVFVFLYFLHVLNICILTCSTYLFFPCIQLCLFHL